MGPAASKPARAVAAKILARFDADRSRNRLALDDFLDATAERQRATDLTLGTARNLVAIDTVITAFAGCPIRRISPVALSTLRVAVYELAYCPDTPVYAAVSSAVETAKANGKTRQVGFVNAVLRQVSRHIASRHVGIDEGAVAATLPHSREAGCQFDRDILPDPKTQIGKYLAVCFSLPQWLVDEWLREYGVEQTRGICIASNRRPGVYLRPNLLKTTTRELERLLREADFEVDPSENAASHGLVKIRSPRAVAELPGFAEGLFTVQDPAAWQTVVALAPQTHWRILDLCAAPGVKTTQLAETTDGKTQIIATDKDPTRLKRVTENTTRLGITNVRVVAFDQLMTDSSAVESFDAVLLDVPCSNTGVLARRVEARYRLSLAGIETLVVTQQKLLEIAADLVRPGGKICYSTCSIQKPENGDVVRDFISQRPDVSLEFEKLTLPSAAQPDHDGGYVAVLCRT